MTRYRVEVTEYNHSFFLCWYDTATGEDGAFLGDGKHRAASKNPDDEVWFSSGPPSPDPLDEMAWKTDWLVKPWYEKVTAWAYRVREVYAPRNIYNQQRCRILYWLDNRRRS